MKRYYSHSEAAKLLGLSPCTLTRWFNKGWIERCNPRGARPLYHIESIRRCCENYVSDELGRRKLILELVA